MAKTGRPKLPKEEQKTVTLVVRVTSAEKRRLAKAAARAETKLSTWARVTQLAAAGGIS